MAIRRLFGWITVISTICSYEDICIGLWAARRNRSQSLHSNTGAEFPFFVRLNIHTGTASGNWGDGSWAEPAYYGSENFSSSRTTALTIPVGHSGAQQTRCKEQDSCSGITIVITSEWEVTGQKSVVIAGCEPQKFTTMISTGHSHAGIGGMRSGSFLTHDNTHDGVAPREDTHGSIPGVH